MNRFQATLPVAVGAFLSFAQAVPARAAESVAVKKYVVYPILLPFHARLLGMDDAGDILATMRPGFGGFLYRNGDATIEPWSVPGVSDAAVIPLAINSRGEVAVAFGSPRNAIPSRHASVYVFNSQQQTFRPAAFHPTTKGCSQGFVAYTNSGQMICSAAVVTPSLGSPGSLDAPPTEAARNSFKSFACPDHALETVVGGANNRGQITGSCFFASNTTRAFVYEIATETMKLIDYPNATSTSAGSITDAGEIIGSYAAGTEKGAFIFDGSHYTRLEGVDANSPGKRQSMAAAYYVSGPHSEIIGTDAAVNGAFIAVPVGQPEPRISQMFGWARINKLKGIGGSNAAKEQPAARGQDPNFLPDQYVFYRRPGVTLEGGTTMLSAALGAPIQPVMYVGFNEQGSWFSTDEMVYRWNQKSQTIAFPVTGFPSNLKMPAQPEVPHVEEQPGSSPAAPTHGDSGKLVRSGDENAYLSYVLPTSPPTPMYLKVVRPTNLTPAVLPPAHVGSGDTGSWVYIGEGAQAAIAALMNLDANGKVTWTFLTPAMMQKYLGQ